MRPGHSAFTSKLLLMLLGSSVLFAQEAKVIEREGLVVVTKPGQSPAPAKIDHPLAIRDRLGTGAASRAILQMSPRWLARVDEETDIEITPGSLGGAEKDSVSVALGGLFVFSREEEGELKIVTPSATGGLRGTQLVVRVDSAGKTLMQVIEGEVALANEKGEVLLRAGEAGEAEIGRAPTKTAAIEARNLLQWALYYPAVLSVRELALSPAEASEAAVSLAAYRQGDLLGALAELPAGYAPGTDGGRLYRAAVLLATGRVDAALRSLDTLPTDNRNRQALERLIAAVRLEDQPGQFPPATAGMAVADSYYRQSRHDLPGALAAARRATELDPESAFAWTRLAELEFSFGRTRAASVALERGLHLAPRNAQAHALQGFLLSGEYRLAEAQAAFAEAVRLDGGLANGWLGLGLTKIKQGDTPAGRADLQTAATAEPNRSFLYSYHGKALNLDGNDHLARKDLALAKSLDPQDPTPWLYSAIQTQQENRYNAAIEEMQESLRLNDNRRVYRSRFLLDQDRAVRSSNLAAIYQNNGMSDVAVREATRAVESDYSNASAHLFLANSFDSLRDPRRLLLRYETAWFNELLMANLLAPVGGGPLSQYVSQQEYSRLLTTDGIGGSVVAEWRDTGYFDQKASLFATFGRFSTGLDFAYHDDEGDRPNGANLRKEIYWQMKYQVTGSDLFYALAKWSEESSGDLLQNYDNVPRNLGLQMEEEQKPGLFLLGWNHEWSPGVHTLFVGGHLGADQQVSAPSTQLQLLQRNPAFLQPDFLRPAAGGGLEYTAEILRTANPAPASLNSDGTLKLSDDFQRLIAPLLGSGQVTQSYINPFDSFTQRKFRILSGELQHIWQTNNNTLLFGGRWQDGDFDTLSQLDILIPKNALLSTSPAASQTVTGHLRRLSLYAYDYLSVAPGLTLIAGVSWDRLEHPENFRNPPVNERQVETDRLNGKAGFNFTRSPALTVRGVYTEALGGVSFDESVRLEPVQLAGFNQAYRTIISESLVGSVEAPVYKNAGLSAEGNVSSRTWWGASFNRLTEDVERTVGVFDLLYAPIFPYGLAILPSSTTEVLAYREDVFTATARQLVGDQFALGVTYRHTRAELHYRANQIPVALLASADNTRTAVLEELSVTANWNSPTGWFAQAEALWNQQDLAATAGGAAANSPAGDSFWQGNVMAGRRFNRNRHEVSAGVYNLTDQDYHLSPLTYHRNLPRERTFFVRCRLGF